MSRRSSPGPVTVAVPATSANLGPGFDCLGLALDLHDPLTAEVVDPGLRASRSTGRAPTSLPARRAAPGRPVDARRLRGPRRRAARPAAAVRRTGSRRPRPRLLVGGDRRRAARWPGRWSSGRRRGSTTTPALRWPTRSRATLTTWRPRCSAASSCRGHDGERGLGDLGADRRLDLRGRVRAARPASSTEAARGLLPGDGAARGRRGQHRSGSAAGRGPRRCDRRCCSAATEDFLHQDFRQPRDAGVVRAGRTRCAPTGCRRSSRAPVRPCWCSTVAEARTTLVEPVPGGWASHPLAVDHDGCPGRCTS